MEGPESQVSAFARLVRTAPMIQGWSTVEVGRKALSARASTRRVVLVPIGGPIENARNTATAHRDIERQFSARLWGKDVDEVCELQTRFVQALAYQSVGGAPNNPNVTPGFYWRLLKEDWDISPATMDDGEEIEMAIIVRQSLDKLPTLTGSVQSVSFGVASTTLSTGMSTTDVAALVASTAGFPTTGGLLSIDAEQIQYTGINGNQLFVGLIRGANGTTPATHASGATVNVS